MKTTSLRLAVLSITISFALSLMIRGTSADGYPAGIQIEPNFVPEMAFRHHGGFDCLYVCGRQHVWCHDHCRQVPKPRATIVVRSDQQRAETQRDYWANSRDFKGALDEFNQDDATYRRQADWYAECMKRVGRHCTPPEPPH
jgi:hypothetical protein